MHKECFNVSVGKQQKHFDNMYFMYFLFFEEGDYLGSHNLSNYEPTNPKLSVLRYFLKMCFVFPIFHILTCLEKPMVLKFMFKSFISKSSYMLACIFTAEGKINMVVNVLWI